jgi:hypothetical protein
MKKQREDNVVENNVQQLMKLLPEGYEEASRETGAMRRNRGVVRKPSDLIRLALTHLIQKSSLVQMSALSELMGIGKLSDVAFMKRFANCCGWFKWMLAQLAPSGIAEYLKPKGLEGYRMLAVDASDVVAAKQVYRLHFALDIFSLASHEFKLTAEKTGESLTNFTVALGDLFLGDRIYGTKRGIAHCLSGGADFILRLRHKAFTILDKTGQKLNLLETIRSATDDVPVDMPVQVDLESEGGIVPLRICALRKSLEAVEQAMKKIKRNCSKRQVDISDECIETNEYIILITSLPNTISAETVLSAYRYRWQIEIYFKRLKSLLSFGEVPKKKPKNIEAWLNGKMLTALLIEIQLSKLDFSPPG